MIVIIILSYCALVYAAFRLIKIPVKPITVTLSILIGIFVVVGILISWQGGAPVSKQTTLTRYVVEINAQLKGLIKKVNVEVGDAVKKGDVIFEIDPVPFQAAVAQANAKLEAARSQVEVAKASQNLAAANADRAKADAAFALTERERADKLFASGAQAISELKVEQLRFASDAANAVVQQTLASQEQAAASRTAAERNVAVAEAALETAQFDLGLTTWEAPSDGVMVNWQAREGTITTALRASAIGTFMDTSDSRVIAVLPQNLMRNVEAGDPVEIAFMSRPGKIDTGKVLRVAKYTGEGQIGASAQLPRISSIGSQGFIAATIKLDDEELARQLSLGEASAVAIYTRPSGPFAVVSKIYIRMLSLMYFVP
ncbi:MAG: HlyD family secretion protein [Hyphomicrobiales bacterium]